ncbi:hypothetical protein SPF06_01505 [Sinomonas sp. JGH33]|uniref:Uncharacterized protein n=1 Tax=Sinomonas terricola TaxID=3110330 RepID=A0ABU5T1H4_9MICC|nr:hypothetical protein [Sinomonas sp. JGH33]MEA5453387.1 hypothetical protein [Sinomonas sp. JGH33]
MSFRNLALGDKVTFRDTGPRPFNVRAISPDQRMVILSRPIEDGSAVEYTMIDWDRGARGLDGTHGRGHILGSGVHRNLWRFFRGVTTDAPSTQTVMDFTNWVGISIDAVNGRP